MSKRGRSEKSSAATKRGGRGPKRASTGTAMTHTSASGQRTYSYQRPGEAGVGRFQAHPRAMQVKLIDKIFSQAYAAGVYTVDTEPLQMIPINDSTNLVQCLNLISQGNGEANRFSNKISLKSVRVRLWLEQTGIVATSPLPFRVILFYDRTPGAGTTGGGAYKASNVVFADMIATNAVQTLTTIGSSLNPTLFDQIVILKDEFHMAPSHATVAQNIVDQGPTENSTFFLDWYVPLKDLESIYSQTQAVPKIADVQTGALMLCVLGEAAANGTDAWQLKGCCRLRFKDN